MAGLEPSLTERKGIEDFVAWMPRILLSIAPLALAAEFLPPMNALTIVGNGLFTFGGLAAFFAVWASPAANRT